ncbi:hypothetical protein ACIA8F_04575 [Streptomyces sp. NPDC051563]|uniref:hypothetical protein n=1 Tax=Streptomyces sp. NPDC051563 TaxID=3365659 RepID=UPI0037881F2C
MQSNMIDHAQGRAVYAAGLDAQEQIRALEAKLRRQSEPTHREAFKVPPTASAYDPHSTDDGGVKTAGKNLDKARAYLSDLLTEHAARQAEFATAVEGRHRSLTKHQEAVSAAVQAGKPLPPAPAPAMNDTALITAHSSLDRLEAGIPVAAENVAARAAELASERERCWATPAYRKWADKELQRLTDEVATAVQTIRGSLAARKSIISHLPDACADLDGVEFKRLGNRLGTGGLNPGGNNGVSAAEALEKISEMATPGKGVRYWMASQLSPAERENYEQRKAAKQIKGA